MNHEKVIRKDQCSFVVFDIESFYPSISEKLLDEAILFAKSHYNFTPDELEIVLHSKKTLLFWNHSTWVKKHGNEDFDIPMGCYDGAEICELVGIYIQSKLCKLMNKKDFGLYRDDGLGILRNTSGPEADRKRKSITKVFKECGLSITCEVNKKIVEFLDVRFNLKDQTYEPYRKPNNNPVYINKHSNHPPNIINEVPKAISKCLTSISCNKNVFDRNIGIYNTALKNSGFDQTLTYDEQDEPTSDSVNEESNQTRKRKRNIIWYNPPYSMSVKTNVGKIFFKLLRKHFPPSHPMYTIFNTNKVKISYSCFPNIGSIISSHNKKILYSDNTEYGCNCNDRNKCPLDNKCLTPRIVYRADVTNDQTQEQKFYYGISDTPFKERYENHKKSFRHKEYSTEPDLAKYCWELKDKGAVPTVKFSIAKCVKGKSLINNCSLCLSEKLFIIRSLDDVNMLNKKSEFISKCRHINKRLLIKVKDESND